jgi:drug/metabolite transporter (DMT)-like permease
MMSLFTFGLCLIGIITAAIYAALIKKSKNKLLLVFWAGTVVNILLILSFIFKQIWEGIPLLQATQDFGQLITDNILFYIIKAIEFVSANLIYVYLLANYSLSSVILILEFALPISTVTYYFLGDPISLQTLIGLTILVGGAILSGFKKFTFPNIFKPFYTIPLPLYILGGVYGLLKTLGTVIMFILTDKNSETLYFHKLVSKMPVLGHFPITYYNTIDYKVGLGIFITTAYIIYLVGFAKISFKQLKKSFKEEFALILLTGGIYFVSTYIYLYVYQEITDKMIIIALSKFNIPLTMTLAYFMLKEKITRPQIVGALMIVGGGLLTAF